MDNIRELILQFQGLCNQIPYRKYLGQTPIQLSLFPIKRQQYIAIEDDNTIFPVDGSPYLYKWVLPIQLESTVRILNIESIYNPKLNRQYFPTKINNNSIIFSIQPERSLDFSRDNNYRNKLVDELIITYQYTDQSIQFNLIPEKQTYGQYNLAISPINGQQLSGNIIFNESQILDFSDITETNRTILYTFSIYDQKLHIYKSEILDINQMDILDLEELINIQKQGIEILDPRLVKIHEQQLPAQKTISINGQDFDLPEPKISLELELQQLSELVLSDLPNELLFSFVQQMQQVSEDQKNNGEISISEFIRKSEIIPSFSLYVWGYNCENELGTNNYDVVYTPIQTTILDQKDVTIGEYGTIILDYNNCLWAQGQNYGQGQLGVGDSYYREEFTQIGSSTWKKVSMGRNFTLAILNDNTLWGWGNNYWGQLGNPSGDVEYSPIKISNDEWNDISAGENSSIALKQDNTLWQWGYNQYGQLGLGDTINRLIPTQVSSSTWKQIQQGNRYTFTILYDNTLWQTGRNNYGQLGMGDTITRLTFTQVGSSTWKQIQQGYEFVTGILGDGSLWQWGRSNNGQVGTIGSTPPFHPLPVLMSSSTFKQVSQHLSYHALQIMEDDTLWGWGNNWEGEVGYADRMETISSPLKITEDTYIYASQGYNHTLVIKTDGTLWGCGTDNDYGQIGIGTSMQGIFSLMQQGTSTWKIVNQSRDDYTYSMGILHDDTLWGWGNNYYGQLGIGGTSWRILTKTQVGTSTWKSITTGDKFSFGIRSDNTLWGQGNNYYGQLGLGYTSSYKSSFTQSGTSTWKQVQQGYEFQLGILYNDTLWQWGKNLDGQLGIGGVTSKVLTKTQVGTSTWKQIQQGYAHTIGLLHDNTLWQWGNNEDYQLGLGDTVNRLIPTQIGSSTWKWISTGWWHTIACQPDDTIYGWGYNGNNRILPEQQEYIETPTKIGDSTWKLITQGPYHTLGILNDDTLWGWGSNWDGVIPTGPTGYEPNVTTPKQIGTRSWKLAVQGWADSQGLMLD